MISLIKKRVFKTVALSCKPRVGNYRSIIGQLFLAKSREVTPKHKKMEKPEWKQIHHQFVIHVKRFLIQ